MTPSSVPPSPRPWHPLLLLFLALTACVTSPQQTSPQQTSTGAPAVAFVGVNVVPMTDAETLLPNQTVVIRDGRIAALGPSSRVRIPRGAMRIDAREKFLMPGLADMHVHLEHLQDPDVLKLFLAHGVTTVRNMDGRPYILEWRDSVRAGTLIGPQIVTAGPIIDGSPPLLDDNVSVANPTEAANIVRQQQAAGYDFVKVYTNLSPEAYRAVLASAQASGMPVAGHVPRLVGIAEAADGHESIEHLTDLGGEIDARSAEQARKWHWSKLFLGIPIDEQKLQHTAAALAQSEIWLVPTLIERERAAPASGEMERWLALPQMRLVPNEALDYWQEQARESGARFDQEDWKLLRQARTSRLRVVAALHKAGVRLLAGTDTPNAFVVPGASLHEELALFVEAGLTPGQALLLATREPARFLGRGSSSGVVQPGYEADLLLLESNPLTSIRAARDVRGVMVDGRWFGEADLARLAQALRQ